MPDNRATIYSNGIADFLRVYPVESGKTHRISIPVRQHHLADLLASITVSGNVRIDGPPSFQPVNVNDSQIALSPDSSLIELVHQLIGAEVEISLAEKSVRGRLVGTQDRESVSTGEPVTEQSLVISNEDGMCQIDLRHLVNLQFTDSSIRDEIQKSLNRRLQSIKPDSTFVELGIRTNRKKAHALVQYTIPAAAWKISYRMIIGSDSTIELQGHAIVDNNTDEDWNDFVVSVVMGQPISFTTDLAHSKSPRRSHVNVVPESALGNIDVESTMEEFEIDAMMAESDEPEAVLRKEGAVLAAASPAPHATRKKRTPSAASDPVQAFEAGDFCIFESEKPVSIQAHRSAVIPVLQTTLDDSASVLHFHSDNHPLHPFRSIRFKNSLGYSLARGVCTVFDGSTYVGSCILPNTAASDSSLLPHALETSVKVRQSTSRIHSRRIGLKISDGIAYDRFHKLQRTEILINNHRNEGYEFILDYDQKWAGGEVTAELIRSEGESKSLELAKLSQGSRAEFRLNPHESAKVIFVDTCVTDSRIALIGASPSEGIFRTNWLIDNLMESNVELLDQSPVIHVLNMQRRLDEANDQIQNTTDERKRLVARQKRLRENIKAGANDHQTAKWRDDLGTSEDHIVRIEEQVLPDLLVQRDQCQQELYDALTQFSLDWTE